MDEEEIARLQRLLALTEANRRSQEEQQKLESIRNEMAGLRQAATEDDHRQKSLPQCPACGGRLDGEFRKCKHCAGDLVWIDGHVCEPGQEEALRQRMPAIRQRIAAEEESLRQRIAAAGQEEALRQRIAAEVAAEFPEPDAYQKFGCAFAVFIVLCIVFFVVVPSCLGE